MVRRRSSRASLRLVSSDDTRAAPPTSRDRYLDLDDLWLAGILAAEDIAEEFGLNPHVRSTCRIHRCWTHQCIAEPAHVNAETGHRWCQRCESPADVDIDERAGSVRLRCTRCGRPPDSAANHEVLNACRTSLAAERAGTPAPVYPLPGRRERRSP